MAAQEVNPAQKALWGSPKRKRHFAKEDFLHFYLFTFLLTGSEFKQRTLNGQNLGPPPSTQGMWPAPGVQVSAQ